MPARLVTMWCPQWSATASGQDVATTPVAVLRANRVRAVSALAAAAGVEVGLRRREAQARCPGLVITELDPDRDARQFEPIVRAVAELVPLLEITEPGLLTFPSRGPSRYCGGDEALAARVTAIAAAALGELFGTNTGSGPGSGSGGIPAPAVGIADGRFASGVAARRAEAVGQACVVPRGAAHTAAFLERFPLSTLHEVGGLSTDLIGLLRRLGLSSLGAVGELPSADLLARFGPEGLVVHHLANGTDDRPAETREPPPELCVRHEFEEPVNQIEALVFGARRMAEKLYERLAGEGTVCTRLAVEAETEFGERTERVWYHQTGMRPAAMVERIRWQLDGWVRQPGGLTGGVIMFAITPVEVRADNGRQLGFWGGITQADEWAARAMTRIGGLLGPEAVTMPVWRGGRDPAAVYAQVQASLFDLDGLELSERCAAVGNDPSRPWPGALPAPAPALFATPGGRRCDLFAADGTEVAVSGRGLISAPPTVLRAEGKSFAIQAWAGPWTVEQRWWDPATAERKARMQLVTESGSAYLVTRQSGAWFIEAIYA
jgi:protein ImuB